MTATLASDEPRWLAHYRTAGAGLPRLRRMPTEQPPNRPGRAVLCSAALLASMIASMPLAAHAQAVQKCRIDGHIVFQSSPCPLEARPAANLAPPSVVADSSGAPKKKGLADLLRERDGADRVRPAAREAQGDGANVLRSRMGAI